MDLASIMNEGQGSSLASVQPSFASPPAAGREPKADRKRPSNDGSDAEDNDRDKRRRLKAPAKSKLRVRCPFKDHDPGNPQFERCGSFDEWGRLRQHLLARKHRPRERCYCCGEIFHNGDKWEEHTALKACQQSSQPLERPYWVNKDQAVRIEALSNIGRKNEASIKEMHRMVCIILFGQEIVPARTGYPMLVALQPTDDLDKNDRSQEPWDAPLREGYDQRFFSATPMGTLPGESLAQVYNASPSQIYSLENRDSSDLRSETAHWRHDGPQPVTPAPYPDHYSPRIRTIESLTSSLAGQGYDESSVIQNASPRPESNAGIALSPLRDHLGAEAWSRASTQQSPLRSPVPRGTVIQTPSPMRTPPPMLSSPSPHVSLNTLLSRDATVLPQMSPTSPCHEVPSIGNHSVDPNSRPGMPSSLLGHKDKEIHELSADNREKQSGALFHECTIADSGYSSTCVARPINDSNSAEEPRKTGTLGQEETPSRLTALDQQTDYTSSVLAHDADYVSDLCNDIHKNLKHELQEHAHTRARPELPRCLPDLIKAFSIRIGLDTSNPSSGRIMHFLHAHHKKIVAALEVLCQDREESPELDHRNTDDEEMTVMERIALWTRKENDQPGSEQEQDPHFVGVDDIEEEDIAGNARMATHRDFVLSSNSYQWLIESLRKQLSLDWGSDHSMEASLHCPIYRSILSKIPPGTVSRHRTPEIHHARFGIKIHPGFLDDLAKGPINDLLTLTSSADNVIQALSVQDYMDQTWPSEGLRLAEIIQEACDGEKVVISADDLDDGTRITAQLARLEHPEPPELLVTVSGSRYSIAEYGEQLAWLCAAFQRPIDKRSIIKYSCNIEFQQETEGALQYSIHYPMQYRNPISVGTTQALCDATIIQGFPTKKRPSGFHGLELGLAHMLKFIDASWPPVFDNGRTFFKGSYNTLELAIYTRDVWLWHIVHPSSTACSFLDCPSRNEHGMPSFDNVLQTEFVAHRIRHVVANMEYFGIPVVGPGSIIFKTLGNNCAQTEISRVEARDDFDPASSPFEDKSNALVSSGDSLDSDMLSISSEDSDSGGNLDLDDPLKSIIDQISHRIWVEYKVSKGVQPAHAGNCEAGDNSGSSANSADNSRSHATSQTQGNEVPQKGKRRAEDDEPRDDGSSKRPRGTEREAVSQETMPTRALACPFWKLEPYAHVECFRMKLSRITDVKQHLRRKHRQPAPDYCQRCWVAFEDQARRALHLSDDTNLRCRYNPHARPPGIDNAMNLALTKKSKHGQSEAEQWFAIWDIVFPDQPRPSSPYIDHSMMEDAAKIQEVIVNRWPSILSSILEGVGGSSISTEPERVEREILIRATLVRLSNDLWVGQARNPPERSASTQQITRAQTSSSSNRADSAIEVGSYQSNNHSSAASRGGSSRMMPGATTMPQLSTRPVARSQSSAVHNRHERFILPQSQNSSNIIHDHQQQMQIPPPTTDSGTMLPDPVNAQTTDFHGTGHSLENDLTTNDLFAQLPEDSAFQSLLESGELGSNALLESMGALSDFDWSTFES